ncbi:uncharacterized protein LOC135385747 isoform X2 [Ornithodoros turicata]|uniref:uncharacterized protein LOC135385747 isoform X2 n=1 Tax=Ornithodoros turicata TaxID=34597 RepID=UPI0031386D92
MLGWWCVIYSTLITFQMFGSCSLHIGERCNFLGFCFVRHARCDSDNICRCTPEFPVALNNHKCGKLRRYQDDCTENGECTQHDNNMYCSQLAIQSRCECLDGFIFNEDANVCMSIKRRQSSPELLLPMAVGISVALSSLLCCVLALYRICYRSSGTDNFLSSIRRRGYAVPWGQPEEPTAPSQHESWSGDTLPSYDVAVSLKMTAVSGPDMVGL